MHLLGVTARGWQWGSMGGMENFRLGCVALLGMDCPETHSVTWGELQGGEVQI